MENYCYDLIYTECFRVFFGWNVFSNLILENKMVNTLEKQSTSFLFQKQLKN